MANIQIPSILSPIAPGAGLDPKAQLPKVDEGSFASHLDRKLREGQRATDNLAGVENKEKAIFTEIDRKEDTPVTVEALLQQLMVDLKGVVDKPNQDPGEWTFQLKNMGLLEKLAAAAGMDNQDLAPLKKMMDEQGSLPLADLFAALEKNFKEQETATEVTVAETYLPLIETFLSQLGVAQDAIQHLDGQGVNGIGQLDLKALLQGMRQLPPQVDGQGQESQIVLSDWDVEQLQTMLSDAGVPGEQIDRIIPERASGQQETLSGLRPAESGQQVTLSIKRLQGMLEQAVAAVENARPKADMPEFFNDLNAILSQAGFESHDVGLSPVVQGAVADVYEELSKMVDLAMVKVEKVSGDDDQALTLQRLLHEIMAKQQQNGDEAGQPTTEELTRALQQAVAAMESSRSQNTELQALLKQVNTILAPTGLALSPTEFNTTIALPTPPVAAPMSGEAVHQLFSDAMAEVGGGSTQNQTLPTLLAKVNEVLIQAGLEIGQTPMDQAASVLPIEEVRQLFNQAFSQGENFSRQAEPLATVVERVNTLLASAGFAITPVTAEEALTPLAAGPEEIIERLQQAITTLAPAGLASQATDAAEVQQALAGLAQESEEKKAEITAKNDALAKERLAGDTAPTSTDTEPSLDTVAGPQSETPTEVAAPESKEAAVPKQMDGNNAPTTGGIGMEARGSAPLSSDPTPKLHTPSLRLSPELQQFAVEQISQGVLRGLRNMEHHLTLTMYPKELGEVKVDMQVRGHHIAVSFVMENQKVKEAMESSMGEFKDNLERRGFSLGNMSVSVDQQQHQNDGGKRFMAAWEQMQATRQRDEGIVPPTVGMPAHSGNRTIRTPQGGISLFV